MIDLYEHWEMDTNGQRYRFVNKDVVDYNGVSNEINEVISKYRAKIKISMFIKWNYLFFTYNGVKFKYRLSNYMSEYYLINEVINELNCIKGIKKVVYEEGTID